MSRARRYAGALDGQVTMPAAMAFAHTLPRIADGARETGEAARRRSMCSGPGDGFLQLDPEGVPLADRLVVAGEYLGALVVKAHPLDRRAREHAEPEQIQPSPIPMSVVLPVFMPSPFPNTSSPNPSSAGEHL